MPAAMITVADPAQATLPLGISPCGSEAHSVPSCERDFHLTPALWVAVSAPTLPLRRLGRFELSPEYKGGPRAVSRPTLPPSKLCIAKNGQAREKDTSKRRRLTVSWVKGVRALGRVEGKRRSQNQANSALGGGSLDRAASKLEGLSLLHAPRR